MVFFYTLLYNTMTYQRLTKKTKPNLLLIEAPNGMGEKTNDSFPITS